MGETNWKVPLCLSVFMHVCVYVCMCVCVCVYALELWKQEPVSGAVTCKKRGILSNQNQHIDKMIFEPPLWSKAAHQLSNS